MALIDRMTGTNQSLQWIHSGGTVSLTGDITNVAYMREGETADATAGADGWRGSIPTVKKVSATAKMHYIGTAGSAAFGSAVLNVAGTVIWGPKGTAAGNPKAGFPGYITKYNFDSPFDNVITLDVEFVASGAELFNPAINVF